MTNILNSPTQLITFNNQNFYIKRDDLLHPDFTGNKARKFYYFFKNDFPNIKKVISHGSNQSNAMYSLSVLCKLKGREFEYYTNHLPSFLKENPQGNYNYALKNGMNLKIGNYNNFASNIQDSILFINLINNSSLSCVNIIIVIFESFESFFIAFLFLTIIRNRMF